MDRAYIAVTSEAFRLISEKSLFTFPVVQGFYGPRIERGPLAPHVVVQPRSDRELVDLEQEVNASDASTLFELAEQLRSSGYAAMPIGIIQVEPRPTQLMQIKGPAGEVIFSRYY